MKHLGGYHARSLGAKPHKGYDGTEKIVSGHIVRNYGGGGGLLGIGLAILTGGASLGFCAAIDVAGVADAIDVASTVDAIDTATNVADVVDTVDTAANTLDAVSSVNDIPMDMSGDMPVSDSGFPSVNDGPMGPPAPDYNPNGFPDPTQPPYDPNGMPDVKPPDPSQVPKSVEKITSKLAKSFANELLPKSTQAKTQTQALGTSNESALSNSGANMASCNFLCNQADLLSAGNLQNSGGLEKLQQLPNVYANAPNPICVYAMQDQMNTTGQAPVGSNLGYAKGGIAHLSEGAQPQVDAQKIWNDAFSAREANLCFGCDKPVLMQNQNSYQCHALKALKHIHPSATGGYAKGGLPEKYHAAAPEGHNPEFVTGLTGYYACGGGTGQSDDIPAMLHEGDYVMDAETVSALGDGSSKAGMHVLDGFRSQVPHHSKANGNPVPAKIADGEYVFPAAFVSALGGGDNKRGAEILDGLRTKLRAHKRGAPLDKIPPKAKDPIDYIKKAKA